MRAVARGVDSQFYGDAETHRSDQPETAATGC